ncbi:conserved hypothetical protein [Magnetospirillum sp. LM-5]|uniref:hypothetical protein n=1 Tax=Magnetospirillum sp. LM-5 TaxID=2681466 RepID=UPI001385B20D|nr:hypothetical protein [Magnetospirillum sp. LM-5]CAA7613903.1 conserved hypothetical protein [Magnetospirillum sp. LM-5]
MDARSLGLILVWVGAILLVAVLQQRLRQGALGEEAFENPPPVARWAVAIASAGMACAGLGILLTVWSFL